MNYYIIAGEASGDLHGANLIKQLKKNDSSPRFRCWGGDLMLQEDVSLAKHYKDLAFMGFVEVIANLGKILRNIKFCKKDIEDFKPDVLILIDYPGFNLRIAEYAHSKGIKIFYYISPQIWAWKESRVHLIKRCVDKMFVILPFEQEFYAKHSLQVDFVGHPLLDALDNYHSDDTAFADVKKPIVALLPGSRKQEVKESLPLMIQMASKFPNYEFIIAGAPSLSTAYYESILGGQSIRLVHQQTYALLSKASAAIVTSGTATLETALFKVPEVVCYKGSKISYWIAKQLVKVKFISLVNLILDKMLVKELIQDEFNIQNMEAELRYLLEDEQTILSMKKGYEELILKLGGPGASAKTANLIFQYLKKSA